MSLIDPDAVEYIPAEAASTYTKLATEYGQRYYEEVSRELSDELTPGGRLLDAGTGPGLLPLLVAERVTELTVDAFDFTAELLQYGRQAADERGLDDRVSFFAADCYTIPVADEQYTEFVSTGVLHALADPSEALREWYRVLEPGGTAWVYDPTIIDLPANPDLELTDHEREVLDTYGVRSEEDDPALSVSEARELVATTPFEPISITEGPEDDLRMVLSRE